MSKWLKEQRTVTAAHTSSSESPQWTFKNKTQSKENLRNNL